MHLVITEPTQVVVDRDDVVSVRAEDASGSFGILPGHTDLITALTPSVVAWRQADGRQGWCAVRRGVLSVHAGREVAIATRQAQVGDDLASLEQAVLARFRAEQDADRQARVAATKLHTAAIREIVRALARSGSGYGEGAPSSSPASREWVG
jgi:F-type H+-transporting ATPase subunit epsilon